MNQTDNLILPWSSHFAILHLEGDGAVVLERAPRWLLHAMNLQDALPLRFPTNGDLGNHPLAPLAVMGRELLTSRLPVQDFLISLRTPVGEVLDVLVTGRFEEDPSALIPGAPGQPAAVMALRDVTEITRVRRKAAAIGAFHGIIGQSLPMLEVFHKIATYGPTEAPVIITGETGTGKELIAKALHDRSARAQGPFVAVNCVALTAELFESELFGHEKGSFTGAYRQHKGRFQRADKGTLFLDEIGDMPLMTQAKMLRALEEGVVERVGGEREEHVDVRVLAATNVALEQAVAARRFRMDLFHRLSVLRIHIPALRDRPGDLPLLVEAFLEVFNRRYGKSIKRLTPEALAMLEDYHWPGNVRELRNVMERLVIETQGEAITGRALVRWMDERDYVMPGEWNADSLFAPRAPIITPTDLPGDAPRAGDAFWGHRSFPHASSPAPGPFPTPARRIDFHPDVVEATILPPSSLVPERELEPESAEPVEITRESLLEAARQAGGNLTRAAKLLGVHKATLYRHMKRLGLSREDVEKQGDEESGSAADGGDHR